jgi:hypothetical protein
MVCNYFALKARDSMAWEGHMSEQEAMLKYCYLAELFKTHTFTHSLGSFVDHMSGSDHNRG